MGWTLFDTDRADAEEVDRALKAEYRHNPERDGGRRRKQRNRCGLRCVSRWMEYNFARFEKYAWDNCAKAIVECCKDCCIATCPGLVEFCCASEDDEDFLGAGGGTQSRDPRSLAARRAHYRMSLCTLLFFACAYTPLLAVGASRVHAAREIADGFEKIGRVCEAIGVDDYERSRTLRGTVETYRYVLTVAGEAGTFTSDPIERSGDGEKRLSFDVLRNCWRPRGDRDAGDLPGWYGDVNCGDADCVVLRDPNRKANALYSDGVVCLVAGASVLAAALALSYLSLWSAEHNAREEHRSPFDSLFRDGHTGAAFGEVGDAVVAAELTPSSGGGGGDRRPSDYIPDTNSPELSGAINGRRAPGANTMQIAVPEGAEPGHVASFVAPNGVEVRIKVPEGLEPGAVFTVKY